MLLRACLHVERRPQLRDERGERARARRVGEDGGREALRGELADTGVLGAALAAERGDDRLARLLPRRRERRARRLDELEQLAEHAAARRARLLRRLDALGDRVARAFHELREDVHRVEQQPELRQLGVGAVARHGVELGGDVFDEGVRAALPQDDHRRAREDIRDGGERRLVVEPLGDPRARVLERGGELAVLGGRRRDDGERAAQVAVLGRRERLPDFFGARRVGAFVDHLLDEGGLLLLGLAVALRLLELLLELEPARELDLRLPLVAQHALEHVALLPLEDGVHVGDRAQALRAVSRQQLLVQQVLDLIPVARVGQVGGEEGRRHLRQRLGDAAAACRGDGGVVAVQRDHLLHGHARHLRLLVAHPLARRGDERRERADRLPARGAHRLHRRRAHLVVGVAHLPLELLDELLREIRRRPRQLLGRVGEAHAVLDHLGAHL